MGSGYGNFNKKEFLSKSKSLSENDKSKIEQILISILNEFLTEPPKRIQYQECLEKANEMEERLYELKEMDELLFKIKGFKGKKAPTYIEETDTKIEKQREKKDENGETITETYVEAVFDSGELKHDELSLDELGRIPNVLETLGLTAQ